MADFALAGCTSLKIIQVFIFALVVPVVLFCFSFYCC